MKSLTWFDEPDQSEPALDYWLNSNPAANWPAFKTAVFPLTGVATRGTFYWASYADYTNRLLSNDYAITNHSNYDHTYIVTGSWTTNGVIFAYQLPYTLGPIAGAPGLDQVNSATFTVKYYIPPGVSRFQSYITTTVDDANNPPILNAGGGVPGPPAP